MLSYQIERIKEAAHVDKIILATSTDASDDLLESFAKEEGILFYRGDLDDVLDRYYRAAEKHSLEHIVRLTGDCPLLDSRLLDAMISDYFENNLDYLCNTNPPTFPDGQDIWVFPFEGLKKAWTEAKLSSEREHVTMYFKNHLDDLRWKNFTHKHDLSFLRWTVDEKEDFTLIETIFEKLYPQKKNFSIDDVLELLEQNPSLKTINQTFERDEGLKMSLEQDQSNQYREKIKQSLMANEQANQFIAGRNHLLSKRPDQYSDGVWPGYFQKAKGSHVWDLDGNKYLDMSIGGIGATMLGYADNDVDNAVIETIKNGVASSFNCPEEVELAKLLVRHHPWAGKAKFTRTGGEANTMAIRLARAYTGKDKIAFCGYHGWHDWYLATNLNDSDKLDGHLLSGLDAKGVPRGLVNTALPFHYNKIDELKDIIKKHKDEVAAIIMEPTRNDPPLEGFLEEVRQIADENKIVLIFDEISVGYRLNLGGAHLGLGVEPDMAVYAKAIGNGYAISAVIGKTPIMDMAYESFISSTCWTERIGPTAALACLQKLERENVPEHLNKLGERVQEAWKQISKETGVPITIGGIKPMSYFSFDPDHHATLKAYYVQEMLKKGIMASNIFYVMYSHTMDDVEYYLKAMKEVFEKIPRLLESNKLESQLMGKPSKLGFKRLL